VSQTAKELAAVLVRHWEQYREYAYPDPASALYRAAPGKRWGRMPAQEILEELPTSIAALSGAPWTVGYGETGPHIGPMTRWSVGSAEVSLQVRLEEFQDGVRRLVKRPMKVWEEAALVSFAWNVGLDEDADFVAEGLGDSTLLRLFNAGDKGAAAEQFLVWIKAGGRKLDGLRNRRIQERAMFLGTHPAIHRA
jgi:lysozyme